MVMIDRRPLERITVCGGAGFIGSHLVDVLTKRNAEITVIDDFSRGSRRNLAAAFETGRVVEDRWNLRFDVPPIPPGIDVVFHLAAKVTGIEYNRHNQYDMLMTNLAINANVVEAVKIAKPRLFVFVSTACVYPHDAPVPTPESYGDVCDPEPTNHGYGVAKWTGEQMVRHLHWEHGIPCIIVRFFNAFGPRDYYDEETSHVAPALIRRVMEGEDPVIVWGTGAQTRVLVDARDIAKALVMLMDGHLEGRIPHHADRPHIVNIGHDREVSIRRLLHEIISLSGRENVQTVFDVTKPDGYPRRAADVSVLKQLIGWVPDTPLHFTLAVMIDEFKSGEAHL